MSRGPSLRIPGLSKVAFTKNTQMFSQVYDILRMITQSIRIFILTIFQRNSKITFAQTLRANLGTSLGMKK